MIPNFGDRMRCRICESDVGALSWYEHIKKHKVAFCMQTGVDPLNYRKIKWEVCVKFFNPRMAREEKQEIKVERKGQCTIYEF
jgi:hypothetical protein